MTVYKIIWLEFNLRPKDTTPIICHKKAAEMRKLSGKLDLTISDKQRRSRLFLNVPKNYGFTKSCFEFLHAVIIYKF